MRLVILSNMAHYYRDSEIVGHGATAREIDHLATLFDEVIHVACLHDEEAPASAMPYVAPNVRLRGVPPAGGPSLRDKARILRLYPQYARVIWSELNQADAVHVRCPANFSLLAIILLSLRRHLGKRWVKYAGNWQAYAGEPMSYRLQRWWLNKGLARSEVTVNGRWPNQPSHVHTFYNPCLTEEELSAGTAAAAKKRLCSPVELLFVGHVSKAKGAYRAVDVMKRLRAMNVPSRLTFVGDGPERQGIERVVREDNLTDVVAFAGWVSRPKIEPYFQMAHIILLPSRTEGWPKVLSEGMAYGAVPVASAVGSIPDVLGDLDLGVVASPEATDRMAAGIAAYVAAPERWEVESRQAVAAAPRFGFMTYRNAVRRLFEETKPQTGAAPVERAAGA